MGQDAEQGIGRHLLVAAHDHQQHGHGEAADHHRQGEIHLQQNTQRDAEQAGMGEGVAKVGHLAPHHEAAEGPGQQGDAEAGREGI
ncbi:hypothetical protein D3C85_990170 [compost metagenome]